jgi:hypothetical protein
MTTPVNLDADVTLKRYETVMTVLLEKLEAWRQENGWCTDFYRYVGQLSRSFVWDPAEGTDGAMFFNIPRTDARRAADLKAIRGRILSFVNDEERPLNLEKANEILEAAGLPGYVREDAAKVRYTLYLPVSTSLATPLSEDEIKARVRELFESLGVADVDRQMVRYALRDENGIEGQVPVAETVRLLPGLSGLRPGPRAWPFSLPARAIRERGLTMDAYPEVGGFLDGFEVRDENLSSHVLVCTQCEAILCTTDPGDSLGLLARVAFNHQHNN